MKKLLATILAFALVVSLAACGGNTDESSHTNSEYIASSSGTSDALNAMSAEEYRELNKFFDAFSIGVHFESIKSEIDIAEACRMLAYLERNYTSPENQDDSWYVIPKENVERFAKNFFDIDSINHENFGDGYRNEYYSTIDGMGIPFETWHNVSALTNNFDGTYTAEVYKYYTHGDIPNNKYDSVSDWTLAPNQQILDGDAPIGDENIFKSHMATLTLKPYQGSWQIVQINGFAIPKKLLF